MNNRTMVRFNSTRGTYYVCMSKSIWTWPFFQRWSIVQQPRQYHSGEVETREFVDLDSAKSYAEICISEMEILKTANQVFSFSEKIQYKNHTILLCGEDIVYYCDDCPDLKSIVRNAEMAKAFIDLDIEYKKQQVIDKLKGK